MNSKSRPQSHGLTSTVDQRLAETLVYLKLLYCFLLFHRQMLHGWSDVVPYTTPGVRSPIDSSSHGNYRHQPRPEKKVSFLYEIRWLSSCRMSDDLFAATVDAWHWMLRMNTLRVYLVTMSSRPCVPPNKIFCCRNRPNFSRL